MSSCWASDSFAAFGINSMYASNLINAPCLPDKSANASSACASTNSLRCIISLSESMMGAACFNLFSRCSFSPRYSRDLPLSVVASGREAVDGEAALTDPDVVGRRT